MTGTDKIRYIGHLDMIRLWERAIRRSDIPAAYTEGFNPRQKLSFGPPLPLGFLSECEYLDIYLDGWGDPNSVKEKLNGVLPPGVEIIEAKNIFTGLASLTAGFRAAEYTAEADESIKPRISEIASSKQIFMKRKEKEFDIRPMILHIEYSGGKLRLTAQCDNFGALKGSEITRLFKDFNIRNITRTNLA